VGPFTWRILYLKKCGIRKEITAPYSPDQSGVSERANRTIVERTKAIMADMDIPKHLWFKVAKSVVYLKNRSPTKSVPTTPYEAWHHQKPNLSHLRIIGTTCYVHIPKEKRIKLDDNAHSAIFLGYAGTNQYQVWDLIREDIVVSRDVVFDEPWRSWKDGESIEYNTETIIPEQSSPKTPTEAQSDEESSSESSSESNNESDDEQNEEPTPEPEQQARTSAQPNKGTFLTTKFADEDYSQKKQMARIAKTINPDNELEPQTYDEAVSHPTRGKQWEQSI
jgi:hypothetical protein